MFSISCEEMKAMDNYTINEIGIPSIVLMERASLEFIKYIDLENNNKFTVVAGLGNNGGDGLAIARHLILENKKVSLYILGNLKKATKDFNTNLNILNNLNVNYINIKYSNDLNSLKDDIKSSDIIIDSIFGVGLNRDITGIYFDTIKLINENSKSIIAVDIPSGINGDSGKVLGISTICNKTITFHKAKHGHKDNKKHIGELIIADIGIPEFVNDYIIEKYRS